MRTRYLPVWVIVAILVGVGIVTVTKPASAAEGVERTLSIDGIRRSYTVDLPRNAAGRRDLRMLFVFHPTFATGKFMADATRLHEMPGSDDLIVVYPDGFMRTWNAGSGCGMAERSNIDNVAFFQAAMKDVGTTASIRPTAYLTEFSNGALPVYYLP
ncbi:MAG: hypothetical protein ACUVQQ_08650 [Thermogutta sp.]